MRVFDYPPLLEGKLLRRYQRFFAEILLDSGETVLAHCPNTGPMTGVSTIGSRVFVSQSNNPKRKLSYTWEIIEVDGELVGINTALPNRVIGKMIGEHLILELEPYNNYKAEVSYGKEKSRIDYLLTGNTPDRYVEIKNTTWCNQNIALFPDTVTTRGQKHLRELITIVKNGQKSTLIYFINRGDCDRFSPGDEADREYGKLFRSGLEEGVQILACRFRLSSQGLDYLGLATIDL